MPPRSRSRSIRYPANMLPIGWEVNRASSASPPVGRIAEADSRQVVEKNVAARVAQARPEGAGSGSGPVGQLHGREAEIDGLAVAGQADADPPSDHAPIEQALEVADALD